MGKGMKMCPRCGIDKPSTLEFFHRNNQNVDKLHGYCKVCRREIHQKYLEDPVVLARVRKGVKEWQKGVGKEKHRICKQRYDKSEKRRAWRRERSAIAKRNAEEYINRLKVKE